MMTIANTPKFKAMRAGKNWILATQPAQRCTRNPMPSKSRVTKVIVTT